MKQRTKARFSERLVEFVPRFAETPGKGEASDGRAAGKGAESGIRLTKQTRLLLLVQALFAAANALSGTFVNVYLWKAKNDFSMIAWFAVSHQITMMLTFWIAGKWVKEHDKMHALRLGVAVSALFYLLVLLLGRASVQYILPLGAVQGLASGFFWLAFNVVYFEVTNPDNRDRFNGWAGLLGSFTGMTAPWISGFLISRLSGTSGYRLIFTVSLAVFVIGVIASFFLKKRKAQRQYHWVYGFRRTFAKGSPWRRVVPAMAAQGIREGVFGFIIGLLVYIATNQEMQLGNYALITSAVSFVSFWLAGRLLKPRFRRWGMLAGVLALSAVILPFFRGVTFPTLLMFGIGTALFMPLFSIPATSVVFDLIGREERGAENRVEYVVLRELALNAGRLFGTVLFIAVIAWNTNPTVLSGLLFCLGSSPLLTWFLLRPWLGTKVARS